MSRQPTPEEIQSEIVFQNSREKDFEDLTDRERYHRTQHHIDATRRQLENESDATAQAELNRKIDSLEHARDQWKDSK